ncbi:zinc-binding dehydrogenase [Roseisolibacter sp. H3M3-2]|uniref:zinc-binding dehydrogenase n=1 Tax=Roseisolibacter sp. H3M3-2 TaxID=3031323 RepID=UPI0023DAA37B|nr:zinc-binding dehydrogenase [Roseisolibacter sp. H3M3-2]MDF1502281.1 zinc-binding dehydrogenase [Roseisolibacter sp. H3M3-2]
MPEPRAGWVRIRVRAFGLNRSELYTRQGHSPSVRFPRVLGIECVGVVDDAGGTDLTPGQTVAALMGEMGRAYDGGYAEYTLVPRDRVLPVRTELPWDVLAALPETWLTAWGSLVDAMDVQAGQTLLIRGGTSSVGMAAASLAKERGLRVLATTRGAAKADALRANGVDDVVVDTGQIVEEVARVVPGGVDALLELIGPVTLRDSLRAVRPRGIVCHTGLLGNVWVMDRFEPLEDIPSTVRLTTYHSGTTSAERSTAALQEIVDGVAAGRYRPNVERVFRFEEIAAAHRFMEEDLGSGKLVVAVDA